MADELTTPAGRLLSVLEKSQNAAAPNVSTWQALLVGLGILHGDQFAQYRAYARLAKQPLLIRELFRGPKLRNMASHIERLGVVETFLGSIQNLALPSIQTFPMVDVAAMDGLRHTDELIKLVGLAESRLGSEEEQNLRIDIDALIAEIGEEPTLDADVKEFVLESLRRLGTSLDDSDLMGLTEVKESVFKSVGEADSRTDIAAAHESPGVKKFWELLGRVALVVNLATGVYNMDHAINSLAAGQAPSHVVPALTTHAETHVPPALPAPSPDATHHAKSITGS